MTRFAVLALLVCPLLVADTGLDTLLSSVESRYNRTRTLQVNFEETYASGGRRRTESGELFLRKPGRMRWVYSAPAEKLFVSDGKSVFYYSPSTKQAERMKLRETEDMRAPLAFLLGRLDFDKDFTGFSSRQEEGGTVITAAPKSGKLPYKQVEFTVAPDNAIRRLVVTGQDNSLLTFVFTEERLNPKLEDALFRFQLPPGAAWVDSGAAEQGAGQR